MAESRTEEIVPWAEGVPGPEAPAEHDGAAGGRSVTRGQSLVILGASGVTAVAVLLAQMLANRALPGEQVKEFLTFWSVLFGIFGIVAGLQQETTRAVGAAGLRSGSGRAGARIMPVAAGFGVVVAALVGATSAWWAHDQVPTGTPVAVLVICLGAALYAMHSAMSGAAAGLRRWYLFAGLGGGEALVRLLALGMAAALAAGLWGFEGAVIVPMVLWIVLVLLAPGGREAFASRADVPAGRLTRNILLAMGSSVGSAVLMTGFPAVLNKSVGLHADSQTKVFLAALILAISVTRSPIMIPLQAFQGLAISAFLRQRHRPVAAFSRPAAALLGIGAVGAAAAWLVGPWLFMLLFHPADPADVPIYRQVADGPVLAVLVFASAFMALLVLSGTAILAMDSHKVYVAGWIVAAAVAVALLYLPLGILPRTVIALYAGPACGLVVHLVGMVAASRRLRGAEAAGA